MIGPRLRSSAVIFAISALYVNALYTKGGRNVGGAMRNSLLNATHCCIQRGEQVLSTTHNEYAAKQVLSHLEALERNYAHYRELVLEFTKEFVRHDHQS